MERPGEKIKNVVTIIQAVTDEHMRHVQKLFAEYLQFLRTDVDTTVADLNEVPALAGYKEELAGLPGKYAPPDGRLLLAQYESEIAGCVAMYKMRKHVCEMKRLWVRPQFRGKKIGRALVEALIVEARNIGYTEMFLTTVDVLKEAMSLYSTLGFEKTTSYFDSPEDAMDYDIFMKLDLSQ